MKSKVENRAFRRAQKQAAAAAKSSKTDVAIAQAIADDDVALIDGAKYMAGTILFVVGALFVMMPKH